MRKIIFSLCLILSTLASGKEVNHLNLGIYHSKCKPDLLPLLIGQEEDLFKKSGISLTVNYYEADEGKETSRDSAKELFKKSDLIVAGRARIYSIESNEPGIVKILSANILDEKNEDYAILVKNESTIKSVKDLLGKKIGLDPNSGRAKFVLMRMILDKLNVDKEKVELKRARVSDLKSGKVDGLYLREPELGQALQSGLYRSIETNPIVKYVQSPWPMGFLASSKSKIAKNQDVIKKFSSVWESAINKVRQNTEYGKQVLKKCLGSAYKLSVEPNLVGHWTFKELDKEAIQKQMTLYYEKGIIKKPIQYQSLVDFEL